MSRKISLPLLGLLAASLLAAGCISDGSMKPLLSAASEPTGTAQSVASGPRGMRPLLGAASDEAPAQRPKRQMVAEPIDNAPRGMKMDRNAPEETVAIRSPMSGPDEEEAMLPPPPPVRTARRQQPQPEFTLPHEKVKVSYPDYVVEPPDILKIDVIRAIPRGPYKVQPLDALVVNSPQALKEEPIAGIYPVNPDGRINLGMNYGTVLVADMTLDQAQEAIRKHLAMIVTKPVVTVSLAQSGGVLQVRGEHLVRQDGTVGLGTYGSVRVTGMTLDEAKSAIESQLSQYLVRPEVSLDVFSYNSKYYYVITDGGGYGEQIYRLPATGNETVLDALAQIGGLPPVASKGRVWVARPAPPQSGCRDQVLPVNYCAVTRGGEAGTNYQLLPGDRVYVMAAPIVTATTWLGRILAPAEQALGVTLLGATTVQTLQGRNIGGLR